MRPSSSGDHVPLAKPRSRKSSVADVPAAQGGPSSHVPTTFFLRSEEEMELSLAASQGTETSGRQRESTFGVQSLADTLEAAFGPDSGAGDKIEEPAATAGKQDACTAGSPASSPKGSSRRSDSSRSSLRRKHARKASNQTISVPLTPINVHAASSISASALPSTPKSVSLQSLKLSDEESGVDDAASQAIASSGEDEDEEALGHSAGTFPQLVMPSIQMPARRPFTAKGKAMGKLKVLIAGDSGLGKTSLIRSIVQLCEDIVHVDPLSTSQPLSQSPPPPKSRTRRQRVEDAGTSKIVEVCASTKAYPHWWTDLEESRVLRRRKSFSDTVLERNLCFVDTPGYSKSSSRSEEMHQVVEYVQSLLYRNAESGSLEDSELLSIISGNGGVQVDVVLYLLSPCHDISKDVEQMQRLSALTNVIPIIARSDTLSPSEIVAIKTSILARLQTTSIKPFFFGQAIDDALLAVQGLTVTTTSSMTSSDLTQYPFNIPTHPYAISTTPGPDTDTMDASLLMSPDYVQPLLPSELVTLVGQVFDPESIAWLRHSAAKKFVAWRRRMKLSGESFTLQGLTQQRLQRSSISSSSVGLNMGPLNASTTASLFSVASPSGVLVPRAASPFYLSNPNLDSLQSPFPASSPSLSHSHMDGFEGPTDFSLARYNNFTQGEQRFAEVRLARWASDLQRSLRNERERFEELQRNERAKWLLERVGEEVRDGKIVSSTTSPRADWAVVRHGDRKGANGGGHWHGSGGRLDARDPLGLCDFSDEVKKRGTVLVKVLGSMTVLGAVMVAVVKACGLETGLPGSQGLWRWITGAASGE
ncbi:Septin-domain-containing protein [Clohesyomyces aquaticus]|uniref:Septin-domain-containing protein n=1 Tax=Clohesyomyces aquaticus TaxID=1231657 RepID=A0A1Y1ZEJ4_9PLEO|nr:Septin-domain-containing protein [Clohesyomyces aquaticus]